MTKLKYTGTATCRVEGFGKFKPGATVTVTEETAEKLIRTGLFKRVIKPPEKTEGKNTKLPENKKEFKS